MVTRFWTYAWKNTSTLPTLKIDLSDHPFIKYDIFEVNVNFPPIRTPVGIVSQWIQLSFVTLGMILTYTTVNFNNARNCLEYKQCIYGDSTIILRLRIYIVSIDLFYIISRSFSLLPFCIHLVCVNSPWPFWPPLHIKYDMPSQKPTPFHYHYFPSHPYLTPSQKI